MTSTAIFPAGKTSIQQANDAIQFITQASLRDKTWTAVPNAVKDERDLLFTYIEEEPEIDVEIIRLFADVESSPEFEFATYERRTATVYEALKRLDRPDADLHLRVVALSRIDPGRKQVVLSERYSLAAIYRGRNTWIAGSRNVPLISIPFPVGKGKPVEWRSGYQPSPTEIMVSFRRQWLRAGQSSQPVPGVDLGRIYGVFLEPDAATQALWLLERYLPLTEPLLISLARSLSGGASLPDSARKEALIAIAFYGILLFRQYHTKETYMGSRDLLARAVLAICRSSSQALLHP